MGLGRLNEAREPMRAGLDSNVRGQDWKNAAISASRLSELELALGEVGAAIRGHDAAVAQADRSGDPSLPVISRALHADALHQAGRHVDAEARFGNAEALQAEREPAYPLLYSLRGFQYCDLLLSAAERAAYFVPARSRQSQTRMGRADFATIALGKTKAVPQSSPWIASSTEHSSHPRRRGSPGVS